jgi:phytoene dehydrogenase-like protein
MPDDALPTAADVVIVGAGLAGLAAARKLSGASLDVLLLEASDAAGGRVRTDRRDGLLLDRGFQLLNPAYPEVRRELDLAALDLQSFRPGVVVAVGTRRYVLGDPRRWPASGLSALLSPIGSLGEKLALARWAVEVGFGPVERIKKVDEDISLSDVLRSRGLGLLGERAVRPFFAGVLAEAELATSRRFGELLLRSFIRGTPALPSRGMQAIPDQLAGDLPPGVLRCQAPVRAAQADRVDTDGGSVRARAILLAADPRTSCTLAGLPPPTLRGLTTFYHRAAEPPTQAPLLHLDGDRRGPVVNTAVVSTVAPSYASDGALIATTVLGASADGAVEAAARRQAGTIYGVRTDDWELVASYPIADALPAVEVGQPLRSSVDLGDGRYMAGDHRDTSSIQGAMVSGRRAAEAILAALR